MAKLETRRFKPTPEEKTRGAQDMTKTEIIEQLIKYKLQNPVKYAQKKEALFARYGLDLQDEPAELVDEEVEELKAVAKKVAKKAAAK